MKVEPRSGQPETLESVGNRARNPNLALVSVLHLGFILTGVVNTMLGPLLPLLSSRWQLSDVQAGNLFVAQFLGSMVGVTISSIIVPRWGARVALSSGLLTMAMGSVGLEQISWSTGTFPLFVLGAGLGLTIPTTNLLISELYSHKRAAALSLINLSWGIGAVICPFLVAASEHSSTRLPILYAIAALLILLVSFIALVSSPAASSTREENRIGENSPGVWRSRFVPLLGAIFFLYVGTEASVGGWIASYAQRAMPTGTAWVITPSYFWASLLVGRSIAPVLLRYVKESSYLRAGLFVALLGILTSLASRNSIQLGASTCCAGLGLASVFPIAIANLSHKFGEAASRIAGLMFNLAGLGGATLPWLVGFTSMRLGNLKFGLFVPLLGCMVMLLLSALIDRPTYWNKSLS